MRLFCVLGYQLLVMHHYYSNMLLLLLSLVCSLIIAEIIYRRFEPPEQAVLFRQEPYSYFTFDSHFGWSLRPGSSGVHDIKEARTSVKINKLGMRYHEVGEKVRARVAFIGDSFTWGFGVEDRQRFSDLLEEQVNLDMLNFGVPGYSITHYYLLVDKVISLKPDLVVIMVCLKNDLVDSVRSFTSGGIAQPYSTIDDGNLKVVADEWLAISKDEIVRKLPIFSSIALGRFAYLYLLKDLHLKLKSGLKEQGLTGFSVYELYAQPPSDSIKKILNISELLLDAINKKLSAEGISVYLFAVPSRIDLENRTAINYLDSIGSRLSIPIIKVDDSFSQRDFFNHDVHWNSLGHKKVADALRPFLSEHFGIKKIHAIKEAATQVNCCYHE